MKSVPNATIKTLIRYLPLLIDNIDKESLKKSLKLVNAVRVTKHQILPKLKRIENDK